MRSGILKINCEPPKTTTAGINECRAFEVLSENAQIIGIKRSISLIIITGFESLCFRKAIMKEFAKYTVVKAPP